MAKRYEYRDKTGEYISGVPARDLDEEEYDALDDDRKDAIHKTKGADGELLYSPVTAPKAKSGGGD